MAHQTIPRLNKWPFLVGDVLLLAVAAWLVWRPGPPLDLWHNALLAGCVALGAWLGVLPFLAEHRAQVRLAEAAGLASTVQQIEGLCAVGEQVAAATACWQSVQNSAEQTAHTAQAMADQITNEARQFAEAMRKAHDAEVTNLRLEVEKLRRAEGDWLQVLVRVLDHVYALYAAGLRSGQPELAAQLGQFQQACRDVARRVGLAPVDAPPDTPFDERLHELPPGDVSDKDGHVDHTLATGFTYQGQLIRRVLVALRPRTEEPLPEVPASETAVEAGPEATEPAAPPAPPALSEGDPAQLSLVDLDDRPQGA